MSDDVLFDTLELAREGGVARLTLNRPEVHNAFNQVVIAELIDAVSALGADDGVRAIVLAGAGKSFCAGADLEWMRSVRDWTAEQNEADARNLAQMLRTIAECPKPVLARVHGAAFGGGVGLAAAADICLAGPKARFCLSEVKLGLTPATIAPHVFGAMGERAARRYWLTAEVISAAEAVGTGLAHEAFEEDEAMDARLDEMTALLCANGPIAIAETKALIRQVADRPNDAALDADTSALIARLRVGEEAQEGLAAFFDKRKPAWAGSD